MKNPLAHMTLNPNLELLRSVRSSYSGEGDSEAPRRRTNFRLVPFCPVTATDRLCYYTTPYHFASPKSSETPSTMPVLTPVGQKPVPFHEPAIENNDDPPFSSP